MCAAWRHVVLCYQLLHCVATCCATLQRVTCAALQHAVLLLSWTASQTVCHVLQHQYLKMQRLINALLQRVGPTCDVLHRLAAFCNMLHYVVTELTLCCCCYIVQGLKGRFSVWQHFAVYRNVLQRLVLCCNVTCCSLSKFCNGIQLHCGTM